ncbi:helix-turn-helix protein [Mucilaginibacter gracilis]|uniref:Helix-turn-helix protein n=1 Tax=Mucilaginibacter gracilis TaxID=423350 RepID=A0A495J8Q8_9SPHI|nr:helix-turn-helix domain-containing protein [Mucilaginibacter gracilis]RKR84429.1 helix-turn-helix protein [Mucilaginibacter gracilis]
MQPTEKLTFEQLPVAISELLERVRRIEAMLCGEKIALDIQDEMLDIKEASAFLKLAVAAIYSKVCRGEIPATKPGRQLYFNKALFEVQFRCENRQNGTKKSKNISKCIFA